MENRTDWRWLSERLLRGLAHELRNPLNAIALALQLLERQLGREGALDPVRVARNMSRATGEIDRCRDVLNEATAIVRREPLTTGPGDLTALVRAVGDALAGTTRGAALRVEAPAEPLPAVVDAVALREAIAELVDNAIDAGGPVTLRLREQGGVARLTVRDAGPGLTETTRSHAFDPFFTTKRDHHGLGLVRARLTAEEHGGALTLEEPEGGGVQAVIELPLGE